MFAVSAFRHSTAIATSSSRCVLALASSVNDAAGQIRFAGGGGRPGGKPTFSWKERRDLQLREKGEKLKVFKLKDFGDFDDIKGFMDESRGDVIIDITDLEDFDFESLMGTPEEQAAIKAKASQDENSRKQIIPSRLFGSAKPTGNILKKYNYNRITWDNNPNRRHGYRKQQRVAGAPAAAPAVEAI